ncbi:MAG: hypothetical protein PHV59_00700 [Victivallales bacterium]|nr:hypothetical protein [Victivallales bacterium]
MTEAVSWGISLSSLDSEKALPRALPECFSLVEMPGPALTPLLQRQLKLSYPNITGLYFREFPDSTVIREIFSQPPAIRNDLKTHLRKIISGAASLKSSGIMLDFGVERSFRNSALGTEITAFINSLSASLYHSGLNLLLPVRIPLPEELESAEPFLEFLKKQMLPQLGFSVDIHPHEFAGKNFNPGEIMRWLEFDAVLLRFVYEPRTGNRLVRKSIEPWLAACRNPGRPLQVMLAPLVQNPETLENELNLLSQLVSGLNNP